MIKLSPISQTLESIFDIVQRDIESSITLKFKIPIVCEKFGKFSKIILDKFSLYRVMNNCFENSILLNLPWTDLNKNLKCVLRDYKINEDELKEYLFNDINFKFYKNIRSYLCLRCVKKLLNLNKKNNLTYCGDIISIGREELLYTYLSLASILYGMRMLNERKFILYYQDFYKFTILDYIISKNFISFFDNDYEFIISFKFCDLNKINLYETISKFESLTDKYNIRIIDIDDLNIDINKLNTLNKFILEYIK